MSGSPDPANLITRALAWRARLAALPVFAGTCAYRFIGLDLTNHDLLVLCHRHARLPSSANGRFATCSKKATLHNVISAVLQTLTGHALVGEVLFDIGMLALAAAVTTLVAGRVLRSAVAGACVAALTVVACPRLYDYPKALIPACTVWLCARYLEQPRMLRAVGIGLFCGCAFLLRHDLGAMPSPRPRSWRSQPCRGGVECRPSGTWRPGVWQPRWLSCRTSPTCRRIPASLPISPLRNSLPSVKSHGLTTRRRDSPPTGRSRCGDREGSAQSRSGGP